MDKEQLKTIIIDSLKNKDIMWFIISEVEDSLDYLNKYKLKNIVDNLDAFIDDLEELSKNYVMNL